MLNSACQVPIECWLHKIRVYFLKESPELLSLFDTYAAEAAFGRRYIAKDLALLPLGAKVLEVGAGAMLLSCQLVREGFEVTGLEPTGFGFAHFDRMRTLILECAKQEGCLPEILDSTAETLALNGCFDFAFSINVMEHVDDIGRSLIQVGQSLKKGASYRFTCPNYLFPYEPHFNIPTLFSKSLTELVFYRRINTNALTPDPSGLWKSLNWITVSEVLRLAKHMPRFKVTFNKTFMVLTLERISSDADFAARRSTLVCNVILLLVKLRLHHLFRLMPVIFQPIMDCKVERLFIEEK